MMNTDKSAVICSSKKYQIARSISLLLLLIGLGPWVRASHDFGAQIFVECVNTCTTRVVTLDWQDCAAVSVPGAYVLNATGSGGGSCGTPSAISGGTNITFTDITPVYPQAFWSRCSNASGAINGIGEYRWEQFYDLCVNPCDEYRFTWSLCCRYANNTFVNSSGSSLYFWTDIDRSAALCNNSPYIKEYPPAILAIDTMLFDLSAVDPDGDSLVYTLSPCYVGASTPATYNPGFSGSAPYGANWDFDLDPQTGLLRITPNGLASAISGPICYMIEEYRSGVKISETHLDMPSFVLGSNLSNIDPRIEGLNNVQNAIWVGDTLYMASLDTATFDLAVIDPDTGIFQDLFLTQNSLGGALASMDTSGLGMDTVRAMEPIGRYKIHGPVAAGVYPMQAQARDQIFISNWISRDTFDFVVKVVDSLPPVWPGDANNDLIANNFDVLDIGLVYGNTGPARINASLNWVAQPGLPWAGTIPGGPNQKFADCDGNATINANDTLAVWLNYGLVHNKKGGTKGTATDPELSLQVLPDSAMINDTIHAPIYLGSSSQPANSVYGVAFTVRFDTALVKMGSMHIDFNNSWMGGTQSLRMGKDLYLNGQYDAVHVRTDQMSVNGNGQIGTLHFIITDNIDGKTQSFETLRLAITDVKLIDQNGVALGVQARGDSLVLSDVLNGQAGAVERGLELWPVPAGEYLHLRGIENILKLEVLDMQGRRLSLATQHTAAGWRIRTAELPKGVYFLRVHALDGVWVKRWTR